MKRLVLTVLTVTLVLGLFSGCSGNKDKKIKIGVLQLVEHAALDASYQGFVDGLKAAGYVDGQNIVIDYQNAQGDQSNCNTISSKLVNDGNDLILAIATPAAQAVANATTEIPILITAVTDPADALLVDSNEAPGRNVTGTSDRTPCAEQMELLKKLVPDAQTVGILYCSSESNSKFQADLAREAAENLGLTVIDFTVSNSNEIQQVVESMIGKVDAVYAPTDNMIAAGMANVIMVTSPNKIPVIVGEDNMLKAGALATYSISYYDLGVLTAQQAVRILNGEKPGDIPIAYLTDLEFQLNEQAAADLGITIPSDLK